MKTNSPRHITAILTLLFERNPCQKFTYQQMIDHLAENGCPNVSRVTIKEIIDILNHYMFIYEDTEKQLHTRGKLPRVFWSAEISDKKKNCRQAQSPIGNKKENKNIVTKV